MFYELLNKKYGHNLNLILVHDSAENIDTILKSHGIENVDYIVSGLPFASLPKECTQRILEKTRNLTCGNTEFITFQYTLLKLGLLKNYFNQITHKKVMRNLPSAYVLKCQNK